MSEGAEIPIKIDQRDRQTELPSLRFEPRPEPSDKKLPEIRTQPQQTEHRVNIAGKFADFQEMQKKAGTEKRGSFFEQSFAADLALAEYSYGERSAELYQELYETVKTKEKGDKNRRDEPNLLKDLGFSLVRAGYRTQGQDLLRYYVDNYGLHQSLTQVSSLTSELIELGEKDIAVRMLDDIKRVVTQREHSLPQDLLSHYGSSNGRKSGEFTAKGEQMIKDFWDEPTDKPKTATQFHELILKMQESGDYKNNKDYDYIMDHPATYFEERHAESLVELAESIDGFNKNASALEDTHPDKAQEYRRLVKHMAKLALFGAQQTFQFRMDKWQREFKGTHYDPEKGLADFVQQLEAHPGTNDEYDFITEATNEARKVLWAVFKNDQLFTQGLDLLYSLDAVIQTTELFTFAAEKIPPDMSPEAFEKFMREWQRTTVQTSEGLAANRFIEQERKFNRGWLLKQDTGVRPASPTDIHLYNQQQVSMAETLLKRPEERYQAQAIQILQSLPQATTTFFNPHEYVSDSTHLFGERRGWSIYTLEEFQQAPFKARALLKGAELSPTHADVLRNQAFDLVQKMSIYPDFESFHQVENKTFVLMKLIESLASAGDMDRALAIYNRIGNTLDRTEAVTQRNKTEFESLSKTEQVNRWGEKFRVDGNVKQIKFWQQYYESRLKAELAIGLQQLGRHAEASQMVHELVASFRQDVTGRRDRFDAESMTSTAKRIADSEAFRSEGIALFDIIPQKLALVRGDEHVFSGAVAYFSDTVRDANLPADVKDRLLSQTVVMLTPANNKDWREMEDSIPGLVKIMDTITKDRNYPQTELASLRVFWDMVKDIQFNRDDSWANMVKIRSMKELFTKIAKNNPEILYGSNFDALMAISHNAEYIKHLSALLPNESEQNYSGDVVNEGIFDIDRIRTGYYEEAATYEQAKTELTRILASPTLTAERLEHMMHVYTELLKQELSSFRNDKQEGYNVTKDELLNLQSIKGLYEIIQDKVNNPGSQFSDSEHRILRTLLLAQSQEESTGKYALYEHLLGNDSVPTLVQRIAFENLLKAKKIGNYVSSYFEDNIISASDEKQREFYGWMKEFLLDRDGHLPSDRITSFLLENPHRAEEFWNSYRRTRNLDTVPESLSRDGFDMFHGLNEHFEDSKEEFLAKRDEFLKKRTFFVPELTNDLDILLAYEKRFSWFMQFDAFVDGIKQIYINGSFDIAGPYDYKYTYTPDQLTTELRKYVPDFELSDEQRTRIQEAYRVNKNAYSLIDAHKARAIPDTRGVITYQQLTEYVTGDLPLTDEQQKRFRRFLDGEENSHLVMILRTFGRDDLTDSQKTMLAGFLDTVDSNFHRRMDKVWTTKVESPRVFENMPDVVKYMLTRFFVQLPYGERQVILSEFDRDQTLPPQKAIKRFFEVTGTEKIGQFLSTRRDIIPEDYRKELEEFQENGEASSFDEVRRTVEREFGKPINQLFSSFESTALNVGTIGEVYEATTLDGQKVVVKVITPSKKAAVKKSLERMRNVAFDLQKNKDRFPGSYDPVALYEEFKLSMEEELDFRREYQNAEEMRKQLPSGITIPRYHPSLSGESILTQSYAKGTHIKEITDTHVKRTVIDRLGNMLLDQFTETGTFHDDLHPGNIRVNPMTGEIELLDFGRTGRANETERNNLLPLLLAIKTKSVDGIISVLRTTSPSKQVFDRIGLEEKLNEKMNNGNAQVSTLISEILFESGNHGLPVNPVYLRMLKAVMTFEGTAHQLDPEFQLEAFLKKVGIKKAVGSVKSSLAKFFTGN